MNAKLQSSLRRLCIMLKAPRNKKTAPRALQRDNGAAQYGGRNNRPSSAAACAWRRAAGRARQAAALKAPQPPRSSSPASRPLWSRGRHFGANEGRRKRMICRARDGVDGGLERRTAMDLELVRTRPLNLCLTRHAARSKSALPSEHTHYKDTNRRRTRMAGGWPAGKSLRALII